LFREYGDIKIVFTSIIMIRLTGKGVSVILSARVMFNYNVIIGKDTHP
jgi:hypothetical protein